VNRSDADERPTIAFSDGVSFNTSGAPRAEKRWDGWYVVGDGMLIPVADEREANGVIATMRPKVKR
jgi:hypothetical protein